MAVSGKKEKDIDIEKLYYKELEKYPLLDIEEENGYLKTLADHKDCILLSKIEVGTVVSYTLNTSLLFNALCDNSMYQDIINVLLDFYSKMDNNNDKAIDKLIKYKKAMEELHRPLNHDELKKLFRIRKETVNLNKLELLREIEVFMAYRLAYEKILVSNLRLVLSLAHKYKYGASLLDLINEGNMALMKAISGYDLSLGYKFSTYANTCIEHRLQKYIMVDSKYIKVSAEKVKEALSFRRKVEELKQNKKRELTIYEIAKNLSVSIDEIYEYYRILDDPYFLDQPLTDEDDYSLHNVVSSDNDVEEDVMKEILKEDIEILFRDLTSKEILVTKMYFGVCEYRDNPSNMTELAKTFKVSPQSVQQIIARSLYKMKRTARLYKEQMAIKEYMM